MSDSTPHSRYSDFDLIGIALDELEGAAAFSESNLYGKAHAAAVDALARIVEQAKADANKLTLARAMLAEKGVDPADLVHELEKVLG